MSLSDFDGLETQKIFFQEDLFEYNDVSEVCKATDEIKIVEKYGDYRRKKNGRFNKIVGFTYSHIMNFKKTSNLKGAIFSANFFSNVDCLVHPKNVIHHAHITGDMLPVWF